MKAKKECVVKIQKSGLPYTIFYPSNFMENFHGTLPFFKYILVEHLSIVRT